MKIKKYLISSFFCMLVSAASSNPCHANGYDEQLMIQDAAKIISNAERANKAAALERQQHYNSRPSPMDKPIAILIMAVMLWWGYSIIRSSIKQSKLRDAKKKYLTNLASKKGYKNEAATFIDYHSNNILVIDGNSKQMLHTTFENPVMELDENGKLTKPKVKQELFKPSQIIKLTKDNEYKVTLNTNSLDNSQITMHYAKGQEKIVTKLYSQVLAFQNSQKFNL